MEWERLPGESAKAYEAARAYFELGSGRSLGAVAERLGKHMSVVKDWSARWKWAARAAAYDAHLRQIEQAARERVLANAAEVDAAVWVERERHAREAQWTLAQELLAKAREMLEEELDKARWSLRDAATFIDLASKLMRAAVGSGEGEGANTLRPDLEALIARVYGTTAQSAPPPGGAQASPWTSGVPRRAERKVQSR